MFCNVGRASDSQRRRFPRFRCDESVTIRVMREEKPKFLHGRAATLGEGGIGVHISEELTVGDVIDLQILLPVGPLHVPASVRYQSGSVFGCEFLALGMPEREYIRNACTQLPRIS